MSFNTKAALQAGWTQEQIDAYLASRVKSNTTAPSQETTQAPSDTGTSVLDSLLNMAGGVAKFIAPGTTKYAQQGMTDIAQGKTPSNQPSVLERLIPGLMMGRGLQPGNIVNNLVAGAKGQGEIKPIMQEDALGESTRELAAMYLGGKILQKILPLATKGGVAKRTTELAEKSTKKGTVIDWDTLEKNIISKTRSKLGNVPEVNQPLETILREGLPNQMTRSPGIYSGNPGMPGFADELVKTPTELLNWRRQILARGGSGNGLQQLLGKLMGSDVESKVQGIARGEISAALKNTVPGISPMDRLYSLYSKGGVFGGDIPTLLKKYGGAYIASQVAKNTGFPQTIISRATGAYQ
jgi:hypothetical protein